MKQTYFSVKQAAEYLSLATSTVYSYIHQRIIPSSKLAGRVVFERSRLDRWVKSKRQEGKK
ncbi:helix-turn-helix domain-containing protein [Treponema primitia]|uniref:helix-turn-helix domain-containing protein n=1 Tax=Treponema primitia TaxID=88058 RepID=UPI0002554E43